MSNMQQQSIGVKISHIYLIITFDGETRKANDNNIFAYWFCFELYDERKIYLVKELMFTFNKTEKVENFEIVAKHRWIKEVTWPSTTSPTSFSFFRWDPNSSMWRFSASRKDCNKTRLLANCKSHETVLEKKLIFNLEACVSRHLHQNSPRSV